MKAEWVEASFLCKVFKTSGSYTVVGFDIANQLLDDHTMMTQAM